MKQIFYPYTVWEDYKNGMYNEDKNNRNERVTLAVNLLSNPPKLYQAMKRVTTEWTYATEQVLTDPNMNHQAFLGQAACNIGEGVKEDETREAWGRLTNEQRYKANKIADRVELEWQREQNATDNYQLSIFEVTT